MQVSCGRETTASPEQSRLWNCYGEMVRRNPPTITERETDSLLDKQVVFVTNNSTKSRADYRKKLETLGIPSTVVSPIQPRTAAQTG